MNLFRNFDYKILHRDTPSSGGMPRSASSYSVQTPDMEDVKESVRQVIKMVVKAGVLDLHHLQGVSKLGGRLSGMASGVMSSIQVHVHDILNMQGL